MYDEKKQVFINYDEKYKTKFVNSESLNSNVEFSMVRIRVFMAGYRRYFEIGEQ